MQVSLIERKEKLRLCLCDKTSGREISKEVVCIIHCIFPFSTSTGNFWQNVVLYLKVFGGGCLYISFGYIPRLGLDSSKLSQEVPFVFWLQ